MNRPDQTSQSEGEYQAARLLHTGEAVARFGPQDPIAAAFATGLGDQTAVALMQDAPLQQTLDRFCQGLLALSETPWYETAALALRERVLFRCARGHYGQEALAAPVQEALRVALCAHLDQGHLQGHEVVRALKIWATPFDGAQPRQQAA
jgi:hypothetical protein